MAAAPEFSVSFPRRGVIRLMSRSFFGDAEAPACRRFLDRVFRATEITGVTIRGGRAPYADLRFDAGASRLDRVVEKVAAMLRQDADDAPMSPLPAARVLDRKGCVRFTRPDPAANRWEIQVDRPGRLRLKNRTLYRQSALCRAVERELASVLGIDRCRVGSLTSTVQVDYDPAQLDGADLIEILDAALAGAGPPGRRDALDLHLPLCTAAIPVAAAAQFAVPALLPAAAALLAYTSMPTFRQAHRALFRERRIGAGVLDSAVVLGCLGTLSILPGAVICWCLGVGRAMVGRTRENSRRMLLDDFGKRPRHARLCLEGAEVRVPIDRVRAGDIVIVDAGDVVPVDGRIIAGRAMIDPHAMTGGSTPALKGPGDRVLAATVAVAGRAYVSVEAAGRETAASHIARALDEAARHELSTQRRGERLAERAAVPTLALGAIGMAAIGPAGAMAVVLRDYGTGLRMAAPLAMLGALALCAHEGILVKDGGAFERMNEVDTVLFDLSGASSVDASEFREVIEGLRRRGIGPIAILSDADEATTRPLAESLGVDRVFAGISPAGRADCVERLRAEGRTVCLVGDAIDDPTAREHAALSISKRGAGSVATDPAQVVLLEEGLARLCAFRDIARDLDRNVRRSWSMIVVPNVACLAGAFTMGFGLMASVLANNVAALAALGNGVLPLRKVAQLEAERRHRLELTRSLAAGRSLALEEAFDHGPSGSTPDIDDAGRAELASPEAEVYHGPGWDAVLGVPDAIHPGHPSSPAH